MKHTLQVTLSSDQIHSIWEDMSDETHTRYLFRTYDGIWYHSDWCLDTMKPCLTHYGKFSLNDLGERELQRTWLTKRDVFELITMEMTI